MLMSFVVYGRLPRIIFRYVPKYKSVVAVLIDQINSKGLVPIFETNMTCNLTDYEYLISISSRACPSDYETFLKTIEAFSNTKFLVLKKKPNTQVLNQNTDQ